MHALTTTVLAYRLPKGSEVLVSLGQKVHAGETIAKTFVSKETISFPLASILNVNPKKVLWLLLKKPGEDIKKGDLVAYKKGFLGLFAKKFHASIDGMIDKVDAVTGDLYVKLEPIEVPFVSDVTGKVVEVSPDLVSVEFQAVEIESQSLYKGKKVGKIMLVKIPNDKDSLDFLNDSVEGKVIAVYGEIGRDFLYKASALGATALIVSSDYKDLVEAETFDKKIKVNSSEVVISMPVFIVENSIFERLEFHHDDAVILDGDSQKILFPKD